MFTWPENILPLPAPDVAFSPSYNKAETRMDSGRERVRPRTTAPVVKTPVRFELTKEQFAFFVAIWRKKLNNGADWFTMRLPQPNTESLTLVQVRFKGDYSAPHKQHENWDISAELELYEEKVISLDEIDAAILYGPDYKTQLAADLEGIDDIFPSDWQYDPD